jgi:BolA family transcriptional regulator, general stress-responsive regulator
MINFLEEIKKKINEEIKPDNLVLIDNSHLHKKHKFFDSNKYHLKVIIKSSKLKKMNKIDAHKQIFSILKNEMNSKIHALEIEIN